MRGGVGSEGGGGGVRVGGSQGGCEWRSEAFVKIQKKNWGGGGVGSGGGSGWWGQGGWEQRIEAFVGGGGSKVWGRWVMWGMGVVCKPRMKGIDKCK